MPDRDDERHPVRVHIVYNDGEEDVIDSVEDDEVILVTGRVRELTYWTSHGNGTDVVTIKTKKP